MPPGLSAVWPQIGACRLFEVPATSSVRQMGTRHGRDPCDSRLTARLAVLLQRRVSSGIHFSGALAYLGQERVAGETAPPSDWAQGDRQHALPRCR